MRKDQPPKEDEVLTAVPELPYLGTTIAEWHFPQENATFHDP